MYHFVMGFTSKLAGTEVGVTEPERHVLSCFGAAFMSQKAAVYAELLAERMADNKARSVLLNTGWIGGAYGKGKRMSLKRDPGAAQRRAVRTARRRRDSRVHPILGLAMPKTAPASILRS